MSFRDDPSSFVADKLDQIVKNLSRKARAGIIRRVARVRACRGEKSNEKCVCGEAEGRVEDFAGDGRCEKGG